MHHKDAYKFAFSVFFSTPTQNFQNSCFSPLHLTAIQVMVSVYNTHQVFLRLVQIPWDGTVLEISTIVNNFNVM